MLSNNGKNEGAELPFYEVKAYSQSGIEWLWNNQNQKLRNELAKSCGIILDCIGITYIFVIANF